jgi:hypothetical protein
LIMDYQPVVLGSLDDHDKLLALASAAVDLARRAGITIAYVRVAFADEDYERWLKAAPCPMRRLRPRSTTGSNPRPATSWCARRASGHSRPPTSNSESRLVMRSRAVKRDGLGIDRIRPWKRCRIFSALPS